MHLAAPALYTIDYAVWAIKPHAPLAPAAPIVGSPPPPERVRSGGRGSGRGRDPSVRRNRIVTARASDRQRAAAYKWSAAGPNLDAICSTPQATQYGSGGAKYFCLLPEDEKQASASARAVQLQSDLEPRYSSLELHYSDSRRTYFSRAHPAVAGNTYAGSLYPIHCRQLYMFDRYSASPSAIVPIPYAFVVCSCGRLKA